MEDNIKRLVQLTGLFYFTVKVYFFGGNSVDTVPFKAKGILKYSANIECNTVDVSFEDPGVKATAVQKKF